MVAVDELNEKQMSRLHQRLEDNEVNNSQLAKQMEHLERLGSTFVSESQIMKQMKDEVDQKLVEMEAKLILAHQEIHSSILSHKLDSSHTIDHCLKTLDDRSLNIEQQLKEMSRKLVENDQNLSKHSSSISSNYYSNLENYTKCQKRMDTLDENIDIQINELNEKVDEKMKNIQDDFFQFSSQLSSQVFLDLFFC